MFCIACYNKSLLLDPDEPTNVREAYQIFVQLPSENLQDLYEKNTLMSLVLVAHYSPTGRIIQELGYVVHKKAMLWGLATLLGGTYDHHG